MFVCGLNHLIFSFLITFSIIIIYLAIMLLFWKSFQYAIMTCQDLNTICRENPDHAKICQTDFDVILHLVNKEFYQDRVNNDLA